MTQQSSEWSIYRMWEAAHIKKTKHIKMLEAISELPEQFSYDDAELRYKQLHPYNSTRGIIDDLFGIVPNIFSVKIEEITEPDGYIFKKKIIICDRGKLLKLLSLLEEFIIKRRELKCRCLDMKDELFKRIKEDGLDA
jgi:hypothetical protein